MAIHDGITVAGEHGAIRALLAGPGAPALGDDGFPEGDDRLAVHRTAGDDHLEAVEFRRIVRPRDLAAAVDLEVLHREVQRRGRQEADIDGGTAGVHDALAEAACEPGTRRPVVAAHGDHRRAAHMIPHRRCKRATQRASKGGGQFLVNDSADIVLAEDALRDIHGSCWRSATSEPERPAACRARSMTRRGQTPKRRFAATAAATIALPAFEKRTWRWASGVRPGFIVIAMTTGR